MRAIRIIASAVVVLAACSEQGTLLAPLDEHKDIPVDFSLGCRNDFAIPGARTDWSCVACDTPINTDAAIDGVRWTYAEIPAGGNIGSVVMGGVATKFKAVLPDGLTYPGGSVIGALVRPASGAALSESIAFATSLNGVPVEHFPGSLASVTVTGNYGDQKRTYVTTLPFNGVELIYSVEGTEIHSSFRVYEFCSE